MCKASSPLREAPVRFILISYLSVSFIIHLLPRSPLPSFLLARRINFISTVKCWLRDLDLALNITCSFASFAS